MSSGLARSEGFLCAWLRRLRTWNAGLNACNIPLFATMIRSIHSLNLVEILAGMPQLIPRIFDEIRAMSVADCKDLVEILEHLHSNCIKLAAGLFEAEKRHAKDVGMANSGKQDQFFLTEKIL